MADLKGTISKSLTAINLKTSNFMEQNKIKTYISTLESEIAILKSEIGDKVYQNWEQGLLHSEGIQEKLESTKCKKDLIREQEKALEVLALKEKQILGEATTKAKEGAVFCSQCGVENKLGYKFCVKCGQLLEERA